MRRFSLPYRGFRPVHAGFLLLCLTLLLIPAGLAQASLLQHKPHQRRAIERLEEQYRQALLTDDVATMRRMLSDDYIGIDPNGIIKTKNETLSDWKNHLVVMHQLELSDLHVRIYGDTAVLTCRAYVVGRGPNGPLTGAYRYTRVYHRQPQGHWKIVNFEANRITKHEDSGAM